MKRPDRGRGLFYSRDSAGRNEQTPPEYVAWARRRADELGVTFRGTPAQMERMLKDGRSVNGDLLFDSGISGHVESRTGLDALKGETKRDRDVTHLFIPRREGQWSLEHDDHRQYRAQPAARRTRAVGAALDGGPASILADWSP